MFVGGSAEVEQPPAPTGVPREWPGPKCQNPVWPPAMEGVRVKMAALLRQHSPRLHPQPETSLGGWVSGCGQVDGNALGRASEVAGLKKEVDPFPCRSVHLRFQRVPQKTSGPPEGQGWRPRFLITSAQWRWWCGFAQGSEGERFRAPAALGNKRQSRAVGHTFHSHPQDLHSPPIPQSPNPPTPQTQRTSCTQHFTHQTLCTSCTARPQTRLRGTSGLTVKSVVNKNNAID